MSVRGLTRFFFLAPPTPHLGSATAPNNHRPTYQHGVNAVAAAAVVRPLALSANGTVDLGTAGGRPPLREFMDALSHDEEQATIERQREEVFAVQVRV